MRIYADARADHLNRHGNDAQGYLEFADLLTKHIRFEERELFPHIEAALPDAALKQIGEFLSNRHAVPVVDDYPDEFWSKNNPSS